MYLLKHKAGKSFFSLPSMRLSTPPHFSHYNCTMQPQTLVADLLDWISFRWFAGIYLSEHTWALHLLWQTILICTLLGWISTFFWANCELRRQSITAAICFVFSKGLGSCWADLAPVHVEPDRFSPPPLLFFDLGTVTEEQQTLRNGSWGLQQWKEKKKKKKNMRVGEGQREKETYIKEKENYIIANTKNKWRTMSKSYWCNYKNPLEAAI